MRLPLLVLTCLGAMMGELRADVINFSVLPPGGVLTAGPGVTTGWGYRLENTSTTDFFQPLNFSADIFFDATTNILFDFPLLAPLETVTINYDGISGLFEATWDIGVNPGAVNSGIFLLSGILMDAGGVITNSDLSISSTYELHVQSSGSGGDGNPSPVPEPSFITLVGASLMLVVALAHGRYRRSTRS